VPITDFGKREGKDYQTTRMPALPQAEAARRGSLSEEVVHSLSDTLAKWEKLYNAAGKQADAR
jgi:hypothetical protein